MSNFTDWAENEVCRIIAGGNASFPENLHIALCSGADDTGFTDVPGLPRVAVARNLVNWSGTQGIGTVAPSNGTTRTIYNNVAFEFGEAEQFVVASYIGIYSGENPLAYVPMDYAMEINAGDDVKIDAGEIVLTLESAGGLTHFAANKLLDMIFRGQTYLFQSSYKIGLFTTAPSLSGGGIEASGGDYNRATLAAWTEPQDGAISNAAKITFPAPQDSWGTVEAAALFSGDDMIFTAALPTPRSIPAGAGAPFFPANSITMPVL